MMPEETILSSPAIVAIGLALLHSLWQGALVGIALACILAVMRRNTPQARYAVSCFSLLLVAALFLATLGKGYDLTAPEPAPNLASAAPFDGHSPTQDSAAPRYSSTSYMHYIAYFDSEWHQHSLSQSLRDACHTFAPQVVFFWLLGVLCLSLKTMAAACGVVYLKKHGVSALSAGCDFDLQRLIQTMGVARPVAFLESRLVQAPTVIGWLRPVILLPASALTGLPPDQFEALIAHELAHVRRYDDLVNLGQVLIETLLFYHPVVWWISRRIRLEREHCCDDAAVMHCGDPLRYARALTAMETLRGSAPSLGLSINGGGLTMRIHRLLEGPSTTTTEHCFRGLMGAASFGLLGIVAAVGALGLIGPAHGADQSRSVSVPVAAAAAPPAPAAAIAIPLDAKGVLDAYARNQDALRATGGLTLKWYCEAWTDSQSQSLPSHMLGKKHYFKEGTFSHDFVRNRSRNQEVWWGDVTLGRSVPKEKAYFGDLLWDGERQFNYARCEPGDVESTLGRISAGMKNFDHLNLTGFHGAYMLGQPLGRDVRLDEMMGFGTTSLHPNTEMVGDSRCLVVDAVSEQYGQITAWFDPERGYTTAKYKILLGTGSLALVNRQLPEGSTMSHEMTAYAFAQTNGIWLPRIAEQKYDYSAGFGSFHTSEVNRMELRSVELNPDLDAQRTFVYGFEKVEPGSVWYDDRQPGVELRFAEGRLTPRGGR